MIQGTASDVGKSTLVAALCRLLVQDGYRVAPFKAQNMSLNAAVTPDGSEIGRAQFAQAEAARVAPTADMNPILLKPTSDTRSQIVVLGRAIAVDEARAYYARRPELWPVVAASLDRLRAAHDVVVIEGAGSPAEINLAAHDIVNMRIARHAESPVLLVGDIERGGVFAALYGTTMLLPPDERRLVRGYVINKFRGDVTLLDPGFAMLQDRTGVPTLGVLPWLNDVGIADEDSLALPRYRAASAKRTSGGLDVAVIQYPHIANFDDFDSLRRMEDVALRFVTERASLGRPALIILPGSKSTIADLDWLRATGLSDAVVSERRAGTPVVGMCGGYQMLGLTISDLNHAESDKTEVAGLGLLPVRTTFANEKRTEQVEATVLDARGFLAGCADRRIAAYEIHMGVTNVPHSTAFAFALNARGEMSHDGMIDADGLTMGCYLHGLFHDHVVRHAVLAHAARLRGVDAPSPRPVGSEDAYDALASLVRVRLNMAAIRDIIGLPSVAHV
jgi:adenosylcobyric acid synthase